MESPHHLAPWPKGRPPLDPEQTGAARAKLSSVWSVVDARLVARVRTKDFAQALALCQQVGALAETAEHHPELALGWGKFEVVLWTHSAGGLTELDFTLARWIDPLLASLESAPAEG
ncbi:MAG: 4a-hydroxytetrahydrobiopterin dehydratase [Planctomycetota bacterium]|nr:4a-hydroxytetrahydrobiopterin dehydratase [Planctomycetota bacterium]